MVNLNPLYSNPYLTLRTDLFSSHKSRELWCDGLMPAWEGNKDSYIRTHSIPGTGLGLGEKHYTESRWSSGQRAVRLGQLRLLSREIAV